MFLDEILLLRQAEEGRGERVVNFKVWHRGAHFLLCMSRVPDFT